MIWLAGRMNRASNPAMTDPVNPHTMRLCLAVYNINGEGGAGGREDVDIISKKKKLALVMTALCCQCARDTAMRCIKRPGIPDTRLQYTERQAVGENSSKEIY